VRGFVQIADDKVRAALIPCDRLVGILGDRGAKPLARPFFLSSCSATGVKSAFSVQVDCLFTDIYPSRITIGRVAQLGEQLL